MNKETTDRKVFHGLELLHYCGGGAYGNVYYCRDISGRNMAVKIISKQKLESGWQRELKGVINYREITENSPELLQIFHVEEDADSFFYTMEAADSASDSEYIPDTLAGRLRHGPLPQTSVFDILFRIFTGIRTIHNAGFAHRDIKPDNIIFVKGVPKLGDIGLLSSLNSTFTQIAGTMDFLPPELRISDGSDSSDRLSRKRNDLYAFGKVIYCAVTGLDPHSWPTVPKELPLSLPLKFFLRLSFQLCDKDPNRRLDSIEDLQKEFAEIERKLAFGETLRDKISWLLKTFHAKLRGVWFQFLKFIRKYWIPVFCFSLLTAGTVWYFWPEPPFDIAREKTRIYRNNSVGFTMTVPKQWEFKLNDEIQREIADIDAEKVKKLSPIKRRRAETYIKQLKFGADFIICDFDPNGQDVILIQSFPDSHGDIKKIMNNWSDARIWAQAMGFPTEVYDRRRTEINGIPCVFVDLSYKPQTRVNNYILLLPDQCLLIGFIAKKSTFKKRKEEFEQVIRTIKFDRKPATSSL